MTGGGLWGGRAGRGSREGSREGWRGGEGGGRSRGQGDRQGRQRPVRSYRPAPVPSNNTPAPVPWSSSGRPGQQPPPRPSVTVGAVRTGQYIQYRTVQGLGWRQNRGWIDHWNWGYRSRDRHGRILNTSTRICTDTSEQVQYQYMNTTAGGGRDIFSPRSWGLAASACRCRRLWTRATPSRHHLWLDSPRTPPRTPTRVKQEAGGRRLAGSKSRGGF